MTHDDMSSASPATDRIFVRDLVLPVRIGAFDHEFHGPQNVRFSVEAEITRPPRIPEHLRDIVSYDLISDGIRQIVAEGHVKLVETLAERIAAHVLAIPRVMSVTVRVEKLEIGPGSVGVEILRTNR
jgi:(5-formylfuran-3-yl)methyl phosphate synthase